MLKYIAIASLLALSTCGAAAPAFAECGIASYYTSHETGGHRTASGRPFRDNEFTAAHRHLPFGSKVTVKAANGRAINVTITDRGPFVRGRIIDLTIAAARALGIGGTGHVCL